MSVAPASFAVPIDIFVFAGQSNMTGILGSSSALPLPFANPNPQVLFNYRVTQGTTIIHDSDQLKPLGTVGITGGSELSFAAAMRQRTNRPFAIVKVAANGTALYDGWNSQLEDAWYASLVGKTKQTITQLTSLQYEPVVSGLFWVQGEGDAGPYFKATAYRNNLTALIENFRADIGQQVPFYANRLHNDLARANVAVVQSAQDYVDQNVPSTRQALINDLTLQTVDNVHFTIETQLELGRRWANMVLPSADLNVDGVVNAQDLAIWKQSIGTTSLAGDANGDNVVDGADFMLWQRQFSSGGHPGLAALASVPEPACATLVMFAVLAVGMRRRMA